MGVVEPNHEDAELSVSKPEKKVEKEVKISSSRDVHMTNFYS